MKHLQLFLTLVLTIQHSPTAISSQEVSLEYQDPLSYADMSSLNGPSPPGPNSLPRGPPLMHPAVFKQPLKLFSKSPITGFYRDGYCRTGGSDHGNHAVAGIVTDEFLDFSAARGNDLRAGAGLKGGCKWCLCTSRWLEAFKAHEQGRLSRAGVPRVDLEATEDSALRQVDLDVFKRFDVTQPKEQ